jgi:hypothetical protein
MSESVGADPCVGPPSENNVIDFRTFDLLDSQTFCECP